LHICISFAPRSVKQSYLFKNKNDIMPKSQLAVIDDLQNNPDYIILNNLFAIPNFVRLAAKHKKERNEIYTPKIFF
jgi:hypothetical protein